MSSGSVVGLYMGEGGTRTDRAQPFEGEQGPVPCAGIAILTRKMNRATMWVPRIVHKISKMCVSQNDPALNRRTL